MSCAMIDSSKVACQFRHHKSGGVGVTRLGRLPGSQQVLHIPNSKIVRTAGLDACPISKPMNLCTDYLWATCPLGSECPNLHANGTVLPSWDPIPMDNAQYLAKPDGATLHAAGFVVKAYTSDRSKYLSIPSQFVAVTQGSLDYIQRFNAQGPFGKFSFSVCAAYQQSSGCPSAGRCHSIHCMESSLQSNSNTVHSNKRVRYVTDCPYERMPDNGIFVRIYDPNLRTKFVEVPMDHVLRTTGALDYAQDPNPRVKVFHCAHYYLKKMCNRGDQCKFIHVLAVDPNAPNRNRTKKCCEHSAAPNMPPSEMRAEDLERQLTTMRLPSPATPSPEDLAMTPTMPRPASPALSSMSSSVISSSPTSRSSYRFDPYSTTSVVVTVTRSPVSTPTSTPPPQE